MHSLYQGLTKLANAVGFAKKKFVPETPNNPTQRYTFAVIISGMKKREKKNCMGFINAFNFKVAVRHGAVTQKKIIDANHKLIKEYEIHRNKLTKLVLNGAEYLKTSIMGMSKFLKLFWKGFAATTPLAVRRERDRLAGLGLFVAREMHQGCYTWSEFRNIDFAGLQVFYEMLEESLLKEDKVPFEEFPEHKGFFMKLMYNRVAAAMNKFFRRKHQPGVAGVDKFGCEIMKREVFQGNIAPNDVTYVGKNQQHKNDVTFIGANHDFEDDYTRRIWDDAPEVVLITDEWGQTPELIPDDYVYTF